MFNIFKRGASVFHVLSETASCTLLCLHTCPALSLRHAVDVQTAKQERETGVDEKFLK